MKPNYGFQNTCVESVIENLRNHGKCLLASAPASGKTEMAIKIIEKMAIKTVVSAHGTLVLSKQFSDRVKGYNKGKKSDLRITIPQAYSRHKHGTGGLFVVDEAHHYFYSKTVQNFIKKLKPDFILVMTGTPGIFNKTNDFPAVTVPTERLLDYQVISSPRIRLTGMELGIARNENGGRGIESNRGVCLIVDQIQSLHGKTIIACRNNKQMKKISNELNSRNLEHHSSSSKVDISSKEIDRFRNSKKQFLLVIRRATLGFSMNDLINIVDISYSLNVDLIFQLYNRVTRLGYERKRYIKICDNSMIDVYYGSLNFACAMVIDEYYRTYTPDNFRHIRTPHIKENVEKINNAFGRGKNGFTGINSFDIDIELLKYNYSHKGYETSIQNIVDTYSVGRISFDEAMSEARKHKGLPVFISKSPRYYRWFTLNGKLLDLYELYGMTKDLTLDGAKLKVSKLVNDGKSRTTIIKSKEGKWLYKHFPDVFDELVSEFEYTKKQIQEMCKNCTSSDDFQLRYLGVFISLIRKKKQQWVYDSFKSRVW
jgi:hypothetical protein